MNFKVDNLCKRKWGWEGYLYPDDGSAPVEFRFAQEKEPTKAQIDNIIAYHTERLTFIKSQPVVKEPDPFLTRLQQEFPDIVGLSSKTSVNEGIKLIKDTISALTVAKVGK
jgi:hypothetical protein